MKIGDREIGPGSSAGAPAEKACSKCRATKPVGEFHRSKTGTHGRHAYCKGCIAKLSRAWGDLPAATQKRRIEAAVRWRTMNPETAKAVQQRYRDRNKRKIRDCGLRKAYGITLEQYLEVLAAQGGVCALCEQPEGIQQQGARRNLGVDHDHNTGAVRGLLCGRCNTALERYDAVPAWAARADAYLAKTPQFYSATTIALGGVQIGAGHRVVVVAEIGINHGGSVEAALELVDSAADAGADAVKSAAFRAEEFCTAAAVYQGRSQVEMFRALELKAADQVRIAERCKARGVEFFGTATDRESATDLLRAGAVAIKIGSDDIVHEPLISAVSEMGVPVLVSTGMASAFEISQAARWAGAARRRFPVLFHCVSLYPTPPEAANLRRIRSLFRYSPFVGYSDHTDGDVAASVAVALGAMVIEKHLTLSRSAPGPDHSFSADPDIFASMVQGIRKTEAILKSWAVGPSDEEKAMAQLARRSIVASVALHHGQFVTREALAYKRPGTGLMPYEADKLIGKTLVRDVAKDEQLRLEDVA